MLLNNTMSPDLIDSLNWRYATKKFDPTKKVSPEDLDDLLETLRLTPSSYGLQPYHFLVIKDEALRDRLDKAAYNPGKVNEASDYIVFCVRTDLTANDVHNFIDLVSQTRDTPLEHLAPYKNSLLQSVERISEDSVFDWASRQAYIAMGMLLMACGLKQIDSCPIEGIDTRAYDDILDLNKKGLRTIASVAIGYRADDDPFQHFTKVRKHRNDIIEFL